MNVATEKTAERMIVVLNCRQSCIAVSEGNTIKGDCKYTVIKQNEKEYDGDAEDDGKTHVIGAHGKDAAEHVVAHVSIHSRT